MIIRTLIFSGIKRFIGSKFISKIPPLGWVIIICILFGSYQQFKIGRLESKVDNLKESIQDYKTQEQTHKLEVERANAANQQVIESLKNSNKQCSEVAKRYKTIANQHEQTNEKQRLEFEEFKKQNEDNNSCYNDLVPRWLLD